MSLNKFIPYRSVVPKSENWFSFLFEFHKANTLRQTFFSMALIGVYAWLAIYLKEKIYHNDENISPAIHSMMGITLGLLLVFRTNTAYDRWWEGRKLVGALVNNTRSLAIKLDAYLPLEAVDMRERAAALITSYVFAFKEHLRGGVKFEELEDLEPEDIEKLKLHFHVPNQIQKILYQEILIYYKNQRIDGFSLLSVDANLNELSNIIGGCERIRKTPLPLAYRMHLKIFILIYVLTLPFGLAHELHVWTTPATMLIFYAMVGIEIIGEEIEDPFGLDESDIPMDTIAHNIRHNVYEILAPSFVQHKT